MSLTGMNGVYLPIVPLGTIRPEDSGAERNARVSALNCTAKLKSPVVWVCLGVDPLDMPRTPYRASEGKRSQYPPYPITPTLTSSSVHHSSHQLTTTFLSYYNVT